MCWINRIEDRKTTEYETKVWLFENINQTEQNLYLDWKENIKLLESEVKEATILPTLQK